MHALLGIAEQGPGMLLDATPPRGIFILPETLVLAGVRFRRRCHLRRRCQPVLGFLKDETPHVPRFVRGGESSPRAARVRGAVREEAPLAACTAETLSETETRIPIVVK